MYYCSDKKRGEIDFLIEKDNKVIPIEVKSGKDYKRHSALTQLMSIKDFNYEKAFVFCNDNIKKENKIIYLPIYMVGFLENNNYSNNRKINLDISRLI